MHRDTGNHPYRMDFVPISDTGAAPVSTGGPVTPVSVGIVSPQPPSETVQVRTTRPTVTTFHLVKPTVVTGQAVRSPVVGPQMVSVVKGQMLGSGARRQKRVVPVVKLPVGSLSSVSPLMFDIKPQQPSPDPTPAEVKAFRAKRMAASVKSVVLQDDLTVDDSHQTSLQELMPYSAPSLEHQPDHQIQLLPPSEPQSQPAPPVEPQPQPSRPVESQPQPSPPPVEEQEPDSPPPARDNLLEPMITLSCGSSYASAMDNALRDDDSQTVHTEADTTPAEDVDTNADVVAATSSAIADTKEDLEDDMPLAARKRKSSSRGGERKRLRSQSASGSSPVSARPPRPFPCDDCEEKFTDRLALAAHERHHGDVKHSCGVCPQIFTQSLALRRHKLHHGQVPRPRSRTGRRSTRVPSRYLDSVWSELGLRRTRGGKRETETVTCGVCDENLTPEQVKAHFSAPKSADYFRCTQCEGVFGQRCQLSRHGCRRGGERQRGKKANKQRASRVSAAAVAAGADTDENSAESPEDAQDSGSEWEPEGADSAPDSAAAADANVTADGTAEITADVAATEDAGASRLTCDVCQINFVSKRNLQRHRAQHENGTRYSCEVCEQSYARIDDLTRHARSAHHQKRQFRCPRCMRTFTQKRIVQYHLRTHARALKKSGSKTGGAAKVSGVTKTESNADEDIKDPSGPGPVRYTCEECGAGFDTRRRFTRHQQLRHDVEPPRYECEVCDASYARIDELTRHSIQIHSQRKTVPCPRCSRFFTQQRIVDYHVVGHDTKRVYMKAPRPFQCSKCSRRFSTEALLSEHDCRYGSSSTQRCVCDICGRGISCPQALRRHRLQHNEERPAKCDTCGAGFIDELALSKHVLTHSDEKPYLCDHCGKGFRFKDYLVRHTRFHTGEKPYQCSACDKSFATSDTLNRHFLIHTGEKPFPCKVCARPFRQAQQLKTHMRVHRDKEVPPYLDQPGEKAEAPTLSMRFSEMTDAEVRLIEDIGGGVRLAENESGGIRIAEVAGSDVRLAGTVAGDMRLAGVVTGDVRLAGAVHGDA